MLKMPYTEKNLIACRKYINIHGKEFLKNWASDMTDKMTIYPVKYLRLFPVVNEDKNEILFSIGFEGVVNARIVWRGNYEACLKYMNGIKLYEYD